MAFTISHDSDLQVLSGIVFGPLALPPNTSLVVDSQDTSQNRGVNFFFLMLTRYHIMDYNSLYLWMQALFLW